MGSIRTIGPAISPGHGIHPKAAGHGGTFRTPTLRHLEHTGPYMHDGSMGSLEEVVRHYNRLDAMLDHHGEALLQPLGLDEASEMDLVAFLAHFLPN